MSPKELKPEYEDLWSYIAMGSMVYLPITFIMYYGVVYLQYRRKEQIMKQEKKNQDVERNEAQLKMQQVKLQNYEQARMQQLQTAYDELRLRQQQEGIKQKNPTGSIALLPDAMKKKPITILPKTPSEKKKPPLLNEENTQKQSESSRDFPQSELEDNTKTAAERGSSTDIMWGDRDHMNHYEILTPPSTYSGTETVPPTPPPSPQSSTKTQTRREKKYTPETKTTSSTLTNGSSDADGSGTFRTTRSRSATSSSTCSSSGNSSDSDYSSSRSRRSRRKLTKK